MTPDHSLIRHTGWAYWPIAFIARLPFAMMTVGVLMLVVAVTGSVRRGGLTSAAGGVGVVVAGPRLGDRVLGVGADQRSGHRGGGALHRLDRGRRRDVGVVDGRVAIAGVDPCIPPKGEQAFDCSDILDLRVHVRHYR